jgi:hypothetical protein
MITLSTGVGRAPLRDRANDLYETPECATLALLHAEKVPRRIWEPACGPGAILSVLRAHGHDVLASDHLEGGHLCHHHRCISKSFYFKLREQGVGPREMRAGARVLISLESAQRWRRRRESTSNT